MVMMLLADIGLQLSKKVMTPFFVARKLKLNLAIHSCTDIHLYEKHCFGQDEDELIHL